MRNIGHLWTWNAIGSPEIFLNLHIKWQFGSQCILAIFFKIFGPKRQKKDKIGPKCAKKS